MKINGSVFNYKEYLIWVATLAAAHQTSGNNPTPERIQYTALNQTRMLRLNKTVEIDPRLVQLVGSLTAHQTWYVISEAWCGDSAQNLPALAKLVDLSHGKIDLKIMQRDENPEWMERYPTEGSKSIPKLIAFNDNGHELFTWGPRPAPAQMILKLWKQNPAGRTKDDFELELHTWYTKDKTATLQREFLGLLSGEEKGF